MATATMLSTMGLSVCAASEGLYQGDNLTEIPAGKILTTDGTTFQRGIPEFRPDSGHLSGKRKTETGCDGISKTGGIPLSGVGNTEYL